jgi:hypothetical protein
VDIQLTLNDYNIFAVPKSLPEYFVNRNGIYYWKDSNAVVQFYQRLSTDTYENLPKSLQLFRQSRDMILNTLTINGELIDYKFGATHTVTDNLRLRDTADVSSATIITTLQKNTMVQVLVTGKTETIDGITAPWVKVMSDTGYVGWCFSGYLK